MLAETLKQFVDQVPVPDEFFCPKCMYLADVNDPEVLAWMEENRPRLLGLDLTGDQPVRRISVELGCRCLRAEEAEKKRLSEIFYAANLPKREKDRVGPRTRQNFRVVAGTLKMIEATDAFMRGEPPRALMLVGVIGSGKTHLAEHMVRATLEKGYSARYELVEELIGTLRHSHKDSEERDFTEWIEWYRRFKLLVLDDIGAQEPTRKAAGYIQGIVDQRLRDGDDLVVLTNMRDRDEMTDEGWDERMASRLFEESAVRVVWSKAEDYRARSVR